MTALDSARGPGAALRRNPAAAWRHLDAGLLGTVLAIASLGVLMVYSATRRNLEGSGDPEHFLKRQALFVVVGLVLMVVVGSVDYRRYRDWAPFAFLGSVGLLVLVLTPLGSYIRGQQSWFTIGGFALQPSEPAKLAVIVTLAAYLAHHAGDIDGRRLVTALVLAGVPMGLIMLQPDVGTTLVFIAVVMGLLVVGGARMRHLAALTVFGVAALVGIFQMDVVKDFQKERLTAFLDQQGDLQGSAYNLDQSKTAIGAGGLTGAGLFQGIQTNLKYVPEQQTDFIFTVVGEELGFLGSGTLLILYAVMCWRIWRSAQIARDLFGSLVCVGVLAMFLFEIFENVGMTMGIMPITGIPLPFMSYGGSSTIANFAAVGLVLNVSARRFT